MVHLIQIMEFDLTKGKEKFKKFLDFNTSFQWSYVEILNWLGANKLKWQNQDEKKNVVQ